MNHHQGELPMSLTEAGRKRFHNLHINTLLVDTEHPGDARYSVLGKLSVWLSRTAWFRDGLLKAKLMSSVLNILAIFRGPI